MFGTWLIRNHEIDVDDVVDPSGEPTLKEDLATLQQKLGELQASVHAIALRASLRLERPSGDPSSGG